MFSHRDLVCDVGSEIKLAGVASDDLYPHIIIVHHFQMKKPTSFLKPAYYA